jgi:hypothetical protein
MINRISTRGAARFAVVILSGLVISGCSAGAAPATDGSDEFLDKTGATDEYDTVVAELEWPPGVTPPARSDEMSGASYQVGVGATDAIMAWNCAWGREWLETREGDPGAAEHALSMYASIVDRPEFVQYFDPDSAQPVVRGIIEEAQLGDPSGVQQDVSINCPADAS